MDGSSKDIFAQKEKLQKAHLEQPSVTQIAHELGLEGSYITDEEVISVLKERIGKKETGGSDSNP
ncbi:hypothetical protein [Tepidibacillus decaturensis]|nr:hypothetical protein [Tepidibacillus decaturensis]